MTVTIKTEEHLLLVEINRPEKMNAMTREMYSRLAQAYFQLDSDPDLRVGIVYAVGPHFTAGLDLTDWADWFARGLGFPLAAENEIDPFYMMSEARCRKPIVMAVQGYCYTWGFEMMLNTDIRVAAADTRFAMLEVKRGFFPAAGATLRLPREIGWANAMRYMLTGDAISAAEAYRLGLVQQVTETGRQFDRALAIARSVAAAAPLGVQEALASSRRAALDGDQAARTVMYRKMADVMQSEDMREGLQSFIERRAAVFKGK
ncbi:MAG: crotonase/enoyl-CoA hydratase family protein [Smithellaceae bacterium]|nr:crotonase/enoyl-CoA hydratase family protein [Syntrophaceae bacterium]MDD4240754.1 crotonase/enoyl-CoA hydratase family protein [Smithellaceae bacterium]NLX50709.1 crotonase/enoyl-CoA hydratase family protein [Deltaproteobacteria bacterium]